MKVLLVAFVLLTTLLYTGCESAPQYAVSEISMDTQQLVGGNAVLLTCVVEAGSGEVPKNGGTSWHVSRGLLYEEGEIHNGKPGQNVMGRSSMSDAERSVYYIPPREGGTVTITVRFKESEALQETYSVDRKPDE